MKRTSHTSLMALRDFPWRQVITREVPRGFLRAIGLRRLPGQYRGAYWARDELGRWELRVPHRLGFKPY